MGKIVKGGRLAWIDDAKMFAMIFVVFGHCMGDCSDTMPGYYLLKDLMVSFNMQFFMFLAGYTAYHSLNRIADWVSYKSYVLKILLHLLLPTFAIGIMRALITQDVAAVGNEQWFLKMLFRYLFVFATVEWLFALMTHSQRLTRYITIQPWMWLGMKYLVFGCLMFVLSKTKLPEFVIYFLFGYLLRKHNLLSRLIVRKKSVLFILFLQFASLGIVLCVFPIVRGHDFYNEPFWMLFNEGQLPLFGFRQLCGFAWIVLLTPFFQFFSKKYTWFSLCGSKSLGLYVIHTFLLHVLVEPMGLMAYTSCQMGWVGAICLSLFLTVLSLIVIWLIERSSLASFLFLGNNRILKYKKRQWIRRKLNSY